MDVQIKGAFVEMARGSSTSSIDGVSRAGIATARADHRLPRRRDEKIELTFSMFRDPFRSISRECRRLGRDVFHSRFLFQRTIFLTGKAASEMFYDSKRFRPFGASLESLRATLLSSGGRHASERLVRHHRKHMFMSLVSGVPALVERVKEELNDAFAEWVHHSEIKLYDEMQKALTKAACKWAGLPLRLDEVDLRTRDFSSLFSACSVSGTHIIQNINCKLASRRSLGWISSLVEIARDRRLEPRTKTPFETVVWHRDEAGRLLSPTEAAGEVLNLLRPTVSTSALIVFGAHALHTHPETIFQLQYGTDEDITCFAEEVKRFYPFFPTASAIVNVDFEWRGHRFKKGQKAVLDLYGTNHDPRAWKQPGLFRPERFRGRKMDRRRYPGDRITNEILKAAFSFLVKSIRYDVPPQDLEIAWARVPAVPRDNFVINNLTRPVH